MKLTWRPANRANYQQGRAGVKVDRVVIHVADGGLDGTATWFENPRASVSAHYIVGTNGDVIQSVSEDHTAFHAGNLTMNRRSIGIEHEGRPSRGPWIPSDAQVEASAQLVAGICRRHGIPVDRRHIIGHNEVDLTRLDRRNCPGPTWPWDRFIARVYRINNPAPVTPAPPKPGHVDDGKTKRACRLFSANTGDLLLDEAVTLIEGTDKVYIDEDKLRAALATARKL